MRAFNALCVKVATSPSKILNLSNRVLTKPKYSYQSSRLSTIFSLITTFSKNVVPTSHTHLLSQYRMFKYEGLTSQRQPIEAVE